MLFCLGYIRAEPTSIKFSKEVPQTVAHFVQGDWTTWVEFTELAWGDRCIGSVAVRGVVYPRQGIETDRNPCYQMFMILLGICSLSTAASLFLIILVPAFATLITVEATKERHCRHSTLGAKLCWSTAPRVHVNVPFDLHHRQAVCKGSFLNGAAFCVCVCAIYRDCERETPNPYTRPETRTRHVRRRNQRLIHISRPRFLGCVAV